MAASRSLMDAAELDVLEASGAGGAAVRGGAMRVAGYGLTAIVGAGSAAVVFRHLGVVRTGEYITALSIVAIIGGFSDLGLTALGLRELAVRDAPGREALMRTLLGMRIAVTIVGVAAGVGFAALAGYRTALVLGVGVAGAALLFQNLQTSLAIGLVRNLRFGWVTGLEVGRQIGLAVLVIVLALSGAGLVVIIAASIPAALITLIATVSLVRGSVPLRPVFARGEWWALLRDLLPFSVAVAVGVLYLRASVVIVSLVCNSVQLGDFSTSFRIIEVLTQIPALMVGAAFPIFALAARDDHVRFAYGVERVFEVAVIVGVMFVLLLALGAPVAIAVVGGAKFHPAIEVVRIQAFALGGSFVGAVWGYALLSLRMQREMIMMSVGALSAGIVLVTVLASLDGPNGAAAATVATEVGLAVAGGVVLGRRHPQLLPSLRRLPRIILAGLGAGALAFIPGLPALVLVAAAALVYVGLLFALRAVPHELTVELLGWRARAGDA
jgi:O-antigen/teichoic acid export membrane protein